MGVSEEEGGGAGAVRMSAGRIRGRNALQGFWVQKWVNMRQTHPCYLRWAKSRESYCRIASENYRSDWND